jgi:uncharacterized protein (TIGR02271 family)
MADNVTLDNLRKLQGRPVYDSQHEKIGDVKEFFLDDATRNPEWIGIGSGGFFGSKQHLVPVEGARFEGDGITVGYTKDQINKTPDIKGDEVTIDQERELYQSYGMKYTQQSSPTGLGQGAQQPLSGGADTQTRPSQQQRTSDSMTRSEEEMRVGKRAVPAGTVRLRKWVETDPVSEDVQLRRERATIERTPATGTGGEITGEQEMEVELFEEEPVVEKRAVPKEELSLGKETEMHEETVQEQLRRERIAEERPDERNRG